MSDPAQPGATVAGDGNTIGKPQRRESFTGRGAFLIAAIGSAVGLGNIWRFPYVAYSNGGGAFIVPYLIALLTAGIPLLFLDYAVGHKFRGSPPMALRRLNKHTEAIGWWQTLICWVIVIYYAAIIAWAIRYVGFSVTKAWGDDPEGFLTGSFLHVASNVDVEFHFVPGVFWPLLILWLVVLAIMATGVEKGITRASWVFMPMLVVMFIALVIVALTLDGASTGLDALFTPAWNALGNYQVWMAAYGQIFFSLSVGFGIMVTYASYLKPKSDLTGSGLVVGFANSSFEILAGLGVFAALGFMATASGKPVSEVAGSGIGLAFIAFPQIISQAGAVGPIMGVLFFVSLVFAGITSMISLLEVVIAAFREKTGMHRVAATWVVGGVTAVASIILFPTTTGLNLLDVTDHFINNIGIVGVALLACLVITWALRKLPVLRDHLNEYSSFKVNKVWMALVGVVAPLVLLGLWITEIATVSSKGYGGMPGNFVGIFGWGMSILVVVLAIVLSLIPWPNRSAIHHELTHEEELARANAQASQEGALS
ncbi:sodium-dependent transporter [Cutibacterium avidum]|uniref:sodium-dependent transporter n=1 Tax=Cutibacterium avidum TaxID=33010 RepID=UPI001C329139|nr:sodium-dependent transporter [Cutibacterium avidum]BCQ02112.1 sodium-dependent transporter [Cutibacterium avidum]